DDARGPGRRVGGNAGAVGVVPDAAEADLLRRHDLPFVVVAYHPGIACLAAQPLQGMMIDRGFRLAVAEFALDLDMIKAMLEVEPFDLGPLDVACAVGHKGELHAGIA